MTPDIFRASFEIVFLKSISKLESIPPEAIRIQTEYQGRLITIQINGKDAPEPQKRGQTPCQRDCYALLEKSVKPMTRIEIIKALDDAGCIWGESTVATALADMVNDGILENSRKRGGYFVPESKQIA